MKISKGLVLFCVALLAFAALAGCSGGKGDVLQVGTEAGFPPFEMFDADGNIIGFDIDIIKYIAEDNGWEIKIIDQDFDTLVESLAMGQLDIVIAAMTITDDRSEKVLFSNPYYDASQVMVVRADEARAFGIDDIIELNLKVAVQSGTTGAWEAEAIFGDDDGNLIQLQRANEAFLELKQGRVDMVIIDEPVAKAFMEQLDGMKIHGEPFTNEQFGIAVNKDNAEMMTKINASLAKMKSSGEYERVFELWFGE